MFYCRNDIDEALNCAIKAGRAEMIKCLLQAKEEEIFKDKKDKEANKEKKRDLLRGLMYFSAEKGQAECVKAFLEEGAHPNDKKKGMQSNCLNIAITNNHR